MWNLFAPLRAKLDTLFDRLLTPWMDFEDSDEDDNERKSPRGNRLAAA